MSDDLERELEHNQWLLDQWRALPLEEQRKRVRRALAKVRGEDATESGRAADTERRQG